MRISFCQMNPIIGDLSSNRDKIIEGLQKAKNEKADFVLFPELALTGYPPEDFLCLPQFIKSVNQELETIISHTKGLAAFIGVPRVNPGDQGKPLCNSACIAFDGKIIGFQDKTLLPTYDVFDELRYFEPAKTRTVWDIMGKKIAVTICEDIWQHAKVMDFSYAMDPIDEYKQKKIDLHFNLSSSPYSMMRIHTRINVLKQAALALNAPSFLCNQVGGNDSLIFEGRSFGVNEGGELIGLAKAFCEDQYLIDLESEKIMELLQFSKEVDIYEALKLGLKDYFVKQGFKKAVLGLSGGIDSTLVACIAAEALGKENVLAIFMPSKYTSKASYEDAEKLCKNLNIKMLTIPIELPFNSFLTLLNPFFEGKPIDTTEENLQARIRGMILMAISNKHGHIVLSTGNKSELALGYSTLYGDLCGGISVISDLSKREVYALSRWINRAQEIIPERVISRPPSAELAENQKDSDTLPDYEIIDNILEAYVEHYKNEEEIARIFNYPLSLVQDITRRIHRNEYKRRQSPPGLRVSGKAFTVGRRFPIVQNWR